MKISLNAVSGGSDLSNRPDTSSIDEEDQDENFIRIIRVKVFIVT